MIGRYDCWLKPKHKFRWTVRAWLGCPLEFLGSSEKDFEKVLAVAIENWLNLQKAFEPRKRWYPIFLDKNLV